MRSPASRLERFLNSRWRLAYFTAAIGVLFWLVRFTVQMVILPSESGLRWVFGEYIRAAADLNAHRDPYGPFLALCRHGCSTFDGYDYPPLFAEILRPLTFLPVENAARVWLVLNLIFLVIIVWIVHRLIRTWISRGALALLATAAAFFVPLFQVFYYFEAGILIALLLTIGAFYFVRRQHDEATGFALALAVLLKVQPIAMAPMLVRSRTDLKKPLALTGMAIGLLALTGLTWVISPDRTVEWFKEVLPLLTTAPTIPENFSLAGVIGRGALLLTGQRPAALSILTLLASFGIVVATWRFSFGLNSPRARAATFASFVAMLPIISSVTWDHHLAIELLVYALMAPSLQIGRASWWMAIASYPLLCVTTNLIFPLLALVAPIRPDPAQIVVVLLVTSLDLLGMLLLWGACLLVLRAHASTVTHDPISGG